MKKGDLIKYRKQPYLSYKIYRIKDATEKYITLTPALNYINNGTIEIPRKLIQFPELFSFLNDSEREEFQKREFQHACYQACVDIDILNDKLEKLDKFSDSHRINGEISSTLIKINQMFERINKKEV